jgi:signal transduction histidine kinase
MENTFGKNIIPDNDNERIKALKRYKIVDTPPENAFDNIARLATQIFNVPISLISLVDAEQVYFKANVGMGNTRTSPRGISLCSLAVLDQEVTVFENAPEEPCLLNNPNVAGSFGLKFYAGAPLTTTDGFRIGTLCIIDKTPRKFDAQSRTIMERMANIVMDEIELRLSAINEIEKQYELMEEAESANEELLAANEARKNDFISIVSHELKTPLTSMGGYIQVLQMRANKNNDTVGRNILDRAYIQTRKMSTLIDGFLNMKRAETEKIPIDLKLFDIADLVKEAEVESLATISSHRIAFAPVEPVAIKADRDKIGQVMTNLINNAVKYSPSGSTIHVACITVNQTVQISVKDVGMGILPADQEKLFDRFYRVDSKQMTNISGFGIGLYLCDEIIRGHGGEIWVESELGLGSTFYFSLPL